jgi:redox-sensitive bicupin YhaK (pirin superfamily)
MQAAQHRFAPPVDCFAPACSDMILRKETDMSITETNTTNDQLVPTEALVRRPADERGKADHGWLKTAHSFSFAGYRDPAHMHFESLRVINDDWIEGGGGFPTHPHEDFEIFSYVLDGAIAHRDSMGNGSTVRAGGVQYMSAGTGVRHSEFNPSETDPMRLLQIWLIPSKRGVAPRYEVRELDPVDKAGRLHLFISEDGREGTIETYAPAEVYAGTFDGEQSASFDLRPGRSAWVQVARGALSVNGVRLERGDGLAVTAPGRLVFAEGEDAEIVFFDLAKLN